MTRKLLSSNTLHAVIIVFVMVAASFVLLVQTDLVSAQATDTQLVVGLQNPATSLNYFDVATNSVWKAYMLEFNFEALYTYDPAAAIYPDLASDQPATGCPAGQTPGPYAGMCHDTEFLNFTVFLHSDVTFTDGEPMTADDVVFSYQTLAWSTNAQVIYPALWWPQPMVPLWNSTAYGGTCAPGSVTYGCMSHIAVKKIAANEVAFQLIPVDVGGVKGAYALYFYATMVVPIIPQHIWQDHVAADALVNWSDPNGGMVSDTFDRSIDTSWTPYTAPFPETIGTGPFHLTSYTPNSETTISVYADYWGNGLSHTWAGKAFPFYPGYLTSVKFQIFTSLDVVSLALQQGSIDTLVWSLTPGFYSQVQSNPSITVNSVTDSGFFYLSFNMRRKPWDDLCLRQAVSRAIDKNYIVKTLMGGFGVAGSVPIGIVNPAYVNGTATGEAFDPSSIPALLTGCGYTPDPATGFFKAPASEGGQIVTATILTPPKDYDPVRADSGIMISKNLKAQGVNINSAPTSFDTIVSRGLTFGQVDYDIYVLGWSLGIFPETYICSFFCTNQDVQTNSAGSNSAGYANPVVDAKINELTYTVNTAQRQQIMQDVEGIVTNAIPWNVLYYRKNLNAYRNDKFEGWQVDPVLNALSAGGGPLNYYTLVSLKPAGTVVPPTPSGTLSVATTLPQRVIANHVQAIPVYVSQNGAPVQGATVSASSALPNHVALNTAPSATTDITGTAVVNWTVPVIQGDLFLTVNVVKGGATATSSKQLEVTVGPPAPMALLSLSSLTPVIAPGGTATVTANLIDGVGNPVAGQTIQIDSTLIVGTVSPTSAVTDANGHATFTYTAPSTTVIPNAHQLDTIRANVTTPDTIVADTQTATLAILVQNDVAPNWSIVSVVGTPGLVLGPLTGTSTNITVKVSDYAGAAKSGILVTPQLDAGETNVTVAPTSFTTGANGLATFRVDDVAALTNIRNVPLRFAASGQLASTSDQVSLLLTNNVAAGWAAQLSFSSRTLAYSAGGTSGTVTVTVYDELNTTAPGAAVMFQIGYGDLGLPAQFAFPYTYVDVAGTGGGYQNIEYGGTGLDLNSFGLGSLGGAFQNSTGPIGPSVPGANIDQGSAFGVENFVNDYEVVNGGNNYATNTTIDSCDSSTYPADFHGLYRVNVTSVTDSNGLYSRSFTTTPIPMDSGMQVFAYIGSAGALNVSIDACNFVSSVKHADLKLDSGVVTQRAPGFALGSLTSATPVFTSAVRTMTFTAKFYKIGGVAADNVQVFAVRGQGSAGRNIKGTFGGTYTTDATGTLTFSNTVSLLSLSQAYYYALLPADPAYSFGGREQLFSQSLGDFWIGPTFEVLLAKFPYSFQRGYLFIPTTVDFATATPASAIVPAGSTTQVKVTVRTGDTAYVGVPDASVWSGSFQSTTDAGGNATFNFTAGLGAAEGWVYVTTADGQVMRAWFGIMALNPVLSYGSITPDVKAVGSESTFTVTVTNLVQVGGTATVILLVDNTTVSAQQVTLTAGGNAPVTFHHVFASTGNHVVTIGTATYTANVPPAIGGIDTTTAYALAIGLLVVGVVVGVLVGMMLSRRRKKPSMAMPEDTGPSTESKPAEEELPPEDKL